MPESLTDNISKTVRIRVALEPRSRQAYFDQIRKTKNGISLAAQTVNLSERTVRDWSRGAHLPTLEAIELLSKTFQLKAPKIINQYDELELKRASGKRGALATNNKYGNPGTPEGRKKGGKNAIAALRLRGGNEFTLAKAITKPKRSSKLAELIGIVLGDGSITNYQVTVSLNNTTDRAYASYVSSLFKELFNLTPNYSVRKDVNTINVVISSVKAVKFLENLGLVKGNKISSQVDMPNWITENNLYAKKCMRGLFDTDGCVYLDKHRYKDKVYLNIGVDFTSYSGKLIQSYLDALRKFGFHPTVYSMKSVKLRRADEVKKFFTIIGTSNLKHKTRYNYFLEQRGEVPKWS